ncbi:MAG: nucleotidyl transferase AbiEii/AbiGii toxin family protein [Patescibacteria group bacterium]
MIDTNLLASESKRIDISPDRLVREAWEILILDQLSQTPWSKHLIFKGGTALRLAWGSPRFSEDLDFSLAATISFTDFRTFCNDLPKKLGNSLTTQDVTKKRFTFFALFRINDPSLFKAFSVKLEISTRLPYLKKEGYALKILNTNLLPQQVLLPVETLAALWDDKLATLRDRKEPRDLFDLWYLSQILQRPLPAIMINRAPQDVKQELNKLVPLRYRTVVTELLSLCKPSSHN